MKNILLLVALLVFVSAQLTKKSTSQSFTQTQKDSLLALVNGYRAKVNSRTLLSNGAYFPQPQTPLGMLAWDATLEQTAQTAVNACGLVSNSANYHVLNTYSNDATATNPATYSPNWIVQYFIDAGINGLTAGSLNKLSVSSQQLIANYLSQSATKFACAATSCGDPVQIKISCLVNSKLAVGTTYYLGTNDPAPAPQPTTTTTTNTTTTNTTTTTTGTTTDVGQFTTAEEQTILDAHNQWRQRIVNGTFVQDNGNVWPVPSTTMPNLTWNADDAKFAQDYLAKCIWEHSSDAERGNRGENLYAGSSKPAAPTAVNSWVSEGVVSAAIDFSYQSNFRSSKNGAMIGHFTQVVWQKSISVGCARRYCSTIQGISWANGGYLVSCVYSNAGNYLGQAVYV